MDARRFDHFSRMLAQSVNRRRVLGIAARAAGTSLGVASTAKSAAAQPLDDNVCTMEVIAYTRVSPEGVELTPEADDALHGFLRFSLEEGGELIDATLEFDSGAELQVLGQVEGYAISLRVDFLPGRTLILVGVGTHPIDTCQGAVDGVLTGPEMGAMGDWHAAVVTSETTLTPAAESQSSGSGGVSQSEDGAGPSATAQAGSGSESETGTGEENGGEGSGEGGACNQTCSGNTTLDQQSCQCVCAPGFTDCGDECFDLSTDPSHCGSCDQVCPDTASCEAGECICPAETCNPGAVIDPSTCDCICPPDWSDCGQACCAPAVSCAGEVCCHGQGTACTDASLCCSGSCDFLVGGGTCAPCRGRSCASSESCCDSQSCVNGYCGGCRDRATSCTTDDQCCFSACTGGACLSNTGGRCARDVDCRECYLDGNCQRACFLGTCGGTLLPDAPINTEVKSD